MITGTKIFTLYPPTDIIFFEEKSFQTVIYKKHPTTYQKQDPLTLDQEPQIIPHIRRSDLYLSEEGVPVSSVPWIHQAGPRHRVDDGITINSVSDKSSSSSSSSSSSLTHPLTIEGELLSNYIHRDLYCLLLSE